MAEITIEKGKQFKGKTVGQNVNKVDARKLVQGKEAYVDDIRLDYLIAKILRSPHAHAKIKKIDITKAEGLTGVHAVLCYSNVPRVMHTTAGQGYPEPSPYDHTMFDNKVRFVGDRVAAVAAETVEIANKALELIEVEYEELPAIFDPERAMDKGAPVIHDEDDAKYLIPVFYESKRNHVAHVDLDIGDVDKALEESDHTFNRKFYTQYAQHVPIEPHVVITYFDPDDRIVIRTSTQVPFHARRIVAQTLQISEKRIRVIKPRIGGGFGTKQEVMLEEIAAMLTMRTGKPVKLELTREEEFYAARTRHQMVVNVRGGVNNDGTITALDLKVISNTGAYGSHGLTVMSNCGSKTLPLYHCDNVRFTGDTVYTNLPVAGAYRGYGATQAAFAIESVIDEMAYTIGLDPLKFRSMNHIKEGETSPIFKALGEGTEGVEMIITSCSLAECIKQGAAEINWVEKRDNETGSHVKRGLGMAMLMQGSSIPEIDMGAVYAKMNDDGSFNLMVGATDLGTGSDTVLSQIFAETLTIPVDDVIIYSSDTDFTPFDVGAYASSTTYLSGMAVKKAADKIKKQILKVAAEMTDEPVDNLACEDKHVINVQKSQEKISFGEIAKYSLYARNQFQISSVASHITHKSPPPFAAHFAEVEVNTKTGEVKVIKYVAAVDCGTAIHPRLAEGQTEGALLNGISYALTEEFIFDEKGKMLNPDLSNYKIFSTIDLPKVKTILVPSYEPTGPYGAKSVSEISINGALPAISNAIYHACGVRMRKSPFTAERVLKEILN
ncbi:MAG: xanthine dehydrogenase family protein molybdopterin-binding subunit [Candidatus Hodarchaeales archaeon]|jgi:putative selenate reductase molybdopterin-binding subunit